jgi:ORF6N domain
MLAPDQIALDTIVPAIFVTRGVKTMLDADLAALYEVETKQLNQAVKRNIRRFPEDFMFQLTKDEYALLRSQSVTANWGMRRNHPYAFTELGVAMLSSVLTSQRAIDMNISIMRAFVLIRQYQGKTQDLKKVIDAMRDKYDQQFEVVFQALDKMLAVQSEKRPIGFVWPKSEKG